MADKQIFELTQEDTPAESYRVVVQKNLNGEMYAITIGDLLTKLFENLDANGQAILNAAQVRLNNAGNIAAKDSEGVTRQVITVDAADQMFVGQLALWGGHLYLDGGDDVVLRGIKAGVRTEFARLSRGDLLLGGTSRPLANSGQCLVISPNPGNPTPDSNMVVFYGRAIDNITEARVTDDAGNITTLSSHYQPTGKPQHDDVPFPSHTITSSNAFAGKRITYDLHAMAKALQALTGEQLIYEEDIPKEEQLDWDTVENARQTQRQAQINAWESAEQAYRQAEANARQQQSDYQAALATYAVLPPNEKAKTKPPVQPAPPKLEHPGVKPTPYTPKTKPAWLRKDEQADD